ncbi:Crp/Fnr family transcriptional regulator [Candidatus Bipolaricaulota bacterium]|nr:Crp/Fnr family transcriptional regulator [Candidatus Bipolaricaulota bacterium]MBS3814193.1 Crp/Fnr family transcriptional regulator [Candidatus Bipolaricaulota bacterium]
MNSEEITTGKEKFPSLEDKWEALQPLITRFQIQRGHSLFQQGAPELGIYLLFEGKIKQFRLNAGGRKLIFELSGPGEIVGTETLFNKENHIATAEVISEEAEVGFLERNNFFAFLKENPSLLFEFAKYISTKSMAYKLKLAESTYDGSKKRICRLLVAGSNCELDLTRNLLAQLAGVSYKTTIQVLGELEKRKIIETKDHHIEIKEKRELEELSNSFPLDLEGYVIL